MTGNRAPASHEIALGGTPWRLWRDACVRGAGFPARRVSALRTDALADAADALADAASAADSCGQPVGAWRSYETTYRAAAKRLSRAIAEIARDPLFREAVIWQNPGMVENCLDRISAEAPRNVKGRLRELAVAAYLQRYCLKNDTIGFFGPVGWASLTGDDGLVVAPGCALLAGRTTYFECWAIDEVARVIAGREQVPGWLRPRREPSALLAGGQLHVTGRKPTVLSGGQSRLLMRCDGHRTVGELAVQEPDAAELLAGLRDLGAVRIDLAVPVQARPEQWLRRELERIGDPAVRQAALRPLEDLEADRDAVATSAGDPDKLWPAMLKLGQTFERVTGVAPTRGSGELHAGRTLVYEDAVRDVYVRLGHVVTGALAGPLGLALDSASWLVGEIADRYRALFMRLLEHECQRAGTSHVPLSRLVGLAAPDLSRLPGRGLTEIAAAAVEDFQERWRQVLRIPDGRVVRHSISARSIAGQVAALFPARPAAWSCASQHSPDLMIAVASADALRRGELLLVLGELHMATNTLESRCFVEQHPDPGRLLQAATADHGRQRVVAVPQKDQPFVTSRLNPPTALLSPGYTYLVSGNEAAVPPPSAAVLPAAGLLVRRKGDDLVVWCASSGAELAFFEVIGDLMTGVVASAFSLLATRPYQARVTVDRLVLSREAWTLPVSDASWAFVKDEATRYALARRWRAGHHLPERAFYRVPVEDKPMAVDFRSLVLVNLLAKGVRRSKDAGFTSFGMTEMLPDLDQLWLPDAAGERYTCELRMVATSAERDRHGG